mmetsp:Transcript_21533/g.46333  ORF Transcript_21533/g.46333 Transcript_21533/m.46333 type:complete len:345 (-) Transcript_21533:717-1751(-)
MATQWEAGDACALGLAACSGPRCLWQRGDHRGELLVVRRAETGGSIPADGCRPATGEGAAAIRAGGDVVEGGAILVDEGVQEAESGLARLQPHVIEQREEGSGGRARAAGAGDPAAEGRDAEVGGLRGDVGVGTAAHVVTPRRGGGQVRGSRQVLRDGRRLPRGHGPIVGEASRREADGRLGAGRREARGGRSAADGGHVRRGRGSLRHELGALAVGALVARGEEQGDAAHAGLLELDVEALRRGLRPRVLVLTIRGGEDLRHVGVRGRAHLREPLQERLVLDVVRRAAREAPELRLDVAGEAGDGLDVEHRLDASTARGGVANELREALAAHEVLRVAVSAPE